MIKNKLMRSFLISLSLLTSFLCFSTPSATEVFKLNSNVESNIIHLKWIIKPGNFLYQDRIHWNTNSTDIKFQDVAWPSALPHTDKLGIKHQIYKNHLELNIPFEGTLSSSQKITVRYQGCSEQGVCFPPQDQNIIIEPNTTPTPKNLILELLSFLGIGILMAFTPCVLPMLPIMTRVVIGDPNKQSTKQTFGLAIAYVLGMACTYSLVGAIIASIGKNLFVLMQQPWIMLSMAGIFITFALSTLGLFEIQLPQKFQQKTLNLRASLSPGHYLSAMLMGSLSLLVLSPCITAPLLGALTYITQMGQVWRGGLALFMLGFGMGIPLIIFAVSAGHWLPKAGSWMDNIKQILALLLFGLAALLITRAIHSSYIPLIWVLLGMIAIYLFRPRKNHSKWSCLIRLIIIGCIFIYSMWLAIATLHHKDAPWPFHKNHNHQHHIVLNSTQSLQHALTKQTKHPVLLYFSAKWCTTCKYLEQQVWQDKALNHLYQKATFIKVDITDNTAEQTKLMQQYQVIAPPTVILLEPLEKVATCRLLGEEITIPHLKHWEKIMGKAWSLSACN